VQYGRRHRQARADEPAAHLSHVSGWRAARHYDGLSFLPSAPGGGRPHPSLASAPRGNIRSLCSLASPQTGSRAPPQRCNQTNGQSAGGGSRPRFLISRMPKIESGIALSPSNFITRNSISALRSRPAVYVLFKTSLDFVVGCALRGALLPFRSFPLAQHHRRKLAKNQQRRVAPRNLVAKVKRGVGSEPTPPRIKAEPAE